MNKMRSIFLGSAAFLVAATGAQAADMMMDVKAPREPVYRCDITGFIELPGTDICFKVGGFARLVVVGGQDNWAFVDEFYRPDFIIPDGHTLNDTLEMYGQGRVNFDARTSTEYGTVRAFIEIQATDNDTRTGGPASLRHAFVQFGNWTFGKTWSTFLHLDSSASTTDPYVLVGDNFMRRNQIRYTQSFGNGFSLSVAIEDQEYNNPGAILATGIYATPPAPNFVVNDRNSMPDVVANIRVDGDWGNAQLSGAIHNNEFREVAGNGLAPAPLAGNQTDSEIGWAALFGLVINTPSIGEGDFFSFKAIYTDGAHQYYQDSWAGGANVVWGLCNWVVPALGGCITDTVTTWSVMANFTHNWTPTFNTTIGGGYGQVSVPTTQLNFFAPLAGFATDQEVDTWDVYLDFAWTPVPRTTFQVDLVYGNIDLNGSGTFGGTFTPYFFNPLANDSDGAFSAAFQVTRSF
ncbi:porin [Microbaculum marinum]|uniref:Porin n=2 Tax=Microbaculum marinum TaxID=1764581 RepID=A0AAW9RJ09_9HYPH